jgi:hypothetical protein
MSQKLQGANIRTSNLLTGHFPVLRLSIFFLCAFNGKKMSFLGKEINFAGMSC